MVESTTQRNTCQVQNISRCLIFLKIQWQGEKFYEKFDIIFLVKISASERADGGKSGKRAMLSALQLFRPHFYNCFDRIFMICCYRISTILLTASVCNYFAIFLQSAKYLFGLNFSDAHICAAFDRNFTHCNYFHTFVLFRDASKCFDRISSLGNYFYIFIRPM